MSMDMSNEFTSYNPEDIIDKKARGLEEDNYLGIVKEVGEKYIITKKTIRRGGGGRRPTRTTTTTYDIPRNLVDHFDSDTVYFKITKEEAKQYEKV